MVAPVINSVPQTGSKKEFKLKYGVFIPNNVTNLTFLSFRMLATLKFVLFNVVLSTTDVATDMLTFFDLLEDNPLWACLTMVWMMMPFLVHTIFFLFKAATGRCKMCTSFTEVMHQFYKEAGIYLPFVSSMHNIWRAKRLFDLKFGTDKFNFKDHKEAEKILDEAGRCSQAESNFEAGPQSVTQVALKRVKNIFCRTVRLHSGCHCAQYWPI